MNFTSSSRSSLIPGAADSDHEADGRREKKPTKTATPSYRFEQKFFKRECKKFIASKKDPNRCCCGRVKGEHGHDALLAFSDRDEVWNMPTHTIPLPTDAYGELEFQGAGQCSRAKYIRLSQDTTPELSLDLLCNGWNLNLPKLLISVTGGAKNFVLHSKLKQVLRQGLLKAAKTTGAWIITGGTNTGVMRHVGEAVRGHTVMSRGAQRKDNAQQIHLIGIATWGIVDHREELVGSEDVVSYHMTPSMTSQGACLDNNHTHFILVDDGTVGKYGGEISYRANLENCISRQEIARSCDGTHGVPVVLLVLEGGPNTIRTVLESVTRSPAVPVVVAEGSGRAADVLAYAHQYVFETEGEMKEMADVVQHRNLLSKVEKAFPEQDKQSCLKIYENVLKCVGNKRYITVFSVDEGGVDIDRAILKALLNGQNTTASHQLSLALVWNRADIARSEIFTDKQKWKREFLESAMMKALVSDRVEFVELLLENGVSMKHFLTQHRLEQLFQETTKTSVTLQHFIDPSVKVHFRLSAMTTLINKLSGIFIPMNCEAKPSIEKSIRRITGLFTDHEDGYYSDGFEYPFNKLLLWAVLANMQKMALFMWQRGDENLAKALVAGKLYKDMSREMAKDERKADVSEALARNSREFLGNALGLLDECYRTNEDIAQQLLTYCLENWGGQNCLSLAVATQHEEFVAHTCCQNLLSEIWMGDMRNGKWASLKFKSNADKKRKHHEHAKDDGMKTSKRVSDTAQAQFSRIESVNSNGEPNVQLRGFRDLNHSESIEMRERRTSPNVVNQVSWSCKFFSFHGAPITKFWANVTIYFLFLMVFSYVILVRFPPAPSVPEIVLIVFVFTLFTEEVRQILDSEPTSLMKKFQDWASSYWNICDGCAIVLFFVAVGLRLNPRTLRMGQVLYCLDIMLWIMRLLHIFSVSKVLGPCVVMIGRMTIDLAYFLLVMVVFLMAYGVAQQGILFPQQEASWEIISKVFFRPYFQVYGELFIDDTDYSEENNSTAFGTPVYDPYSGRLVTIIMAFYLLVANILLLNLLIAIFNNTFSMVQANSNQIWKFQRYQLIMEYEHRPVLVPPLIFLNHLHILYRACYRSCCRCACGTNSKRRNEIDDDKLKPRLCKEDLHKLMLFEEQCSESFLSRKNTLFNASSEERVRVIGERVEALNSQLQETNKEQMCKEEAMAKRVRTIENYLSRVEEYTLQILDIVGNMPQVRPIASTGLEIDENVEAGGGSAAFSRLMSVPAYMHMQQRQDTKGSEMPLYFRRKYPSWAAHQPGHARQTSQTSQTGQAGQAGQASAGNRRQDSVKKAVSRFKRSNTVCSAHEKLSESSDEVSQQQLQNADEDTTHEQGHMRLMRATSEAMASSPRASTNQQLGRKRSRTLPTKSTVEKRDAFSRARSLGLHVRSRQSPYPMSDVQRYPVPDFLVDWTMPFPGYDPPEYTTDLVLAKPAWADLDILDPNFRDVKCNFNAQYKRIDRRSFLGTYEVINGLPRNPMGRTGIAARGLLGRWGPNHAADSIVTRWKLDEEGEVIERLGRRVLEFVAIKRRDNLEWALPGGMVEAGETVSETVRREFCEEALGCLEASPEERTRISNEVQDFLCGGIEVYKGYVDDPRNTDNAWIETVATNFHDDTGENLKDFQLKAGDDACSVQWQEVSSDLKLHANHVFILKKVARLHGAYFGVTSQERE